MSYRRWTGKEKEFLIENKDLPNKVLAEELNRTEQSVAKQKTRMGLANPIKPWSENDKKRVERLWYGVDSKNHTKLGRSYQALKKMAYKQNLGTRYNADGYYLTTSDVGEMLGLHSATIRKYVLEGKINATFYGEKRIARISPDDVVKFIDNYKDHLNKIGVNINKDLLSPYLNTINY